LTYCREIAFNRVTEEMK
jgi:hypothetical protein